MIQGDTFSRQLKTCEAVECEIEVMEGGVVATTQEHLVIVAIAGGNYQVASYHFLVC